MHRTHSHSKQNTQTSNFPHIKNSLTKKQQHMDIPNSQNHTKYHSPQSRNHKKRLTHDQVQLLEASFDASRKLEPELKFQLARQLCVPPRQVAIWYQNKRARWKNHSLELDYGSLQARLDAALSEKRVMEKEVIHLRGELKRAQEMLFGYRAGQAQMNGPGHVQAQAQAQSSCYEEEGGGSSSLNDDVECSANWGNNNNGHELASLQMDHEMYAACFMMGEGSSCGPVPGPTTGPSAFNNERDFWS